MKTTIKKLFLCLTLILFTTLCFAQSRNIQVVSAVGKVEKQQDGLWVPVQVGEVLSKGTLISTGFRSSATLKFEGSVISVSALSRLTIAELLENENSRDTSVFLDAGKIKADIKTSDNKRVSFTVRTPIATASVKGTAGSVSALGDVVSYENVWATTVINPDGTESTKQIPVSQGMHLSLSANVGSNSPVTLTLASDTGVSPLLQNVSEIENEFKGISFVSDSGNRNGSEIPVERITIKESPEVTPPAVTPPTDEPPSDNPPVDEGSEDTTCYVNVEVTYKK
ncbi:MAG: FecR domain-containing protein [Spirochaetaceae bacterium]|nr:FecR domain-containing protein [Spirochaetaceae bacterium]